MLFNQVNVTDELVQKIKTVVTSFSGISENGKLTKFVHKIVIEI